MIKFNTAYGKRKRTQIAFLDEHGEPLLGRTEQCHKQQCDVNNIIRQYDKTGLITHVNQAKADYGDYTEVNEYQQSLNMVINAQNAFMELPSNVRKQFDNNPGEFLEFATNPDNHDKMVDLGLALPKSIGDSTPLDVTVPTDTKQVSKQKNEV